MRAKRAVLTRHWLVSTNIFSIFHALMKEIVAFPHMYSTIVLVHILQNVVVATGVTVHKRLRSVRIVLRTGDLSLSSSNCTLCTRTHYATRKEAGRLRKVSTGKAHTAMYAYCTSFTQLRQQMWIAKCVGTLGGKKKYGTVDKVLHNTV